MDDHWTVSEVAGIAKITVRTLHHYDEIGLLVPSMRSAAGYRLYARPDLERLQQILIYRELGFTLEGIAGLLDAPASERVPALKSQRRQLMEKRHGLERIIKTVDRTLNALEQGEAMNTEGLFEGFEELSEAPEEIRDHHREHAKEAHEQWSASDAYGESMRRVKRYSKAEWAVIQEENRRNESRMADLMAVGANPEGDKAAAGAEAMRKHIDRWYYPCKPAMHACLADMYEADPRFKANYEKVAPGLAAFVATAIRANAGRASNEDPA